MRQLIVLCTLLVSCARAEDDDTQQYVQQSVKGGYGGYQFNPAANFVSIFRNQTHDGSNMRYNMTDTRLEVGVCYIEVPTASLVRDPSHVPAGNGSRADLSRIRTCCKGYIRNIHSFRKCDPVCTNECVNALCTAPETCTCFPDHVKNLAGFCIATCPIGCQNGHCSGGECLCKEGFKLHRDSKFCVPNCRENCGGIGNCTAPNTCECRGGYQTTPEGSCKPACDRCNNGDCVAPNECRCHQGYAKDEQGSCIQQCNPGFHSTPQGCRPICDRCNNGDCIAPNECRCRHGYTKDQQGQCIPQGSNQPPPYQPQNQPSNYPFNPQSQDKFPVPSGVPQCAQPCWNGVCVEGNRCNCNPGYVLDRDDGSGTRCIPNCPGGCPNGICSAPNLCLCNAGYVKDHSVKGRQECVRRVRRSADDPQLDEKKPLNVADLLVFMIPDY